MYVFANLAQLGQKKPPRRLKSAKMKSKGALRVPQDHLKGLGSKIKHNLRKHGKTNERLGQTQANPSLALKLSKC